MLKKMPNKNLNKLLLGALFLFYGYFGFSANAFADSVLNKPGYFSVDTPRGAFECEASTGSNIYVLKVGGKVYFKGAFDSSGEPEGYLRGGLYSLSFECPKVLASRNGYVVVARDVQNPSYGIIGYAIIDFNNDDFPVVELAEAVRSRDEKIPAAKRLIWDTGGVELTYIGYPASVQAGTAGLITPRLHKLYYDFESQGISQLR